jgi:hypothetical protein
MVLFFIVRSFNSSCCYEINSRLAGQWGMSIRNPLAESIGKSGAITRPWPACEMGGAGVSSHYMPQRIEADRETVKQLWLQGLKISKISELTGVNPKTIRTWSSRYGWGKIASDSSVALEQTGGKVLVAQVVADLDFRSRAARAKLAEVLEAQAELIAQNPPSKLGQLANTPKGQGLASVTKTIVEASAKVFGWKEKEERDGLIQLEAADIVTLRQELPTLEAEVLSAGGGS